MWLVCYSKKSTFPWFALSTLEKLTNFVGKVVKKSTGGLRYKRTGVVVVPVSTHKLCDNVPQEGSPSLLMPRDKINVLFSVYISSLPVHVRSNSWYHFVVPKIFSSKGIACVASVPVRAEWNRTARKSFFRIRAARKMGREQIGRSLLSSLLARPNCSRPIFRAARMRKSSFARSVSFGSHGNACYAGF